jgi:hypothetical protein
LTWLQNVGGEAALAGAAFLDRFYADSVTRFLDHDAAAGATHALATDASGVESCGRRMVALPHAVTMESFWI